MSFTRTTSSTTTMNQNNATNMPPNNTTKLTEEQLKRMEENRQRALAIKQSLKNSSTSNSSKNTVAPTTTFTKITSASTIAAATPTTTMIKTMPSTSNNSTYVANPNQTIKSHHQTPITTIAVKTMPSTSNNSAFVAKPNQTITSHAVLKVQNGSTIMQQSKPLILNETISNSIISKPQYDGKCAYLETTNGNHSRFEVIIGYNKTLVEIFKSMNTKMYDPNTKRWNFSIKEYDELMLKIKLQMNNTIKLEQLDRHANIKSIQARFTLCSRERFEAHAEYKADLKEIFDSMHSRKYDSNTKAYSFLLKEYDELMKKISTKFTKGEISIVALPKAVRETFKDQFEGKPLKPRIDPSLDLEHLETRIDPVICKSLLPFQIEGICFAIQQNGRLLLADDMGLGKTIQGLAIASYYRSEWPFFVVVPSSVKFMWKESCKRWLCHSLMEVCKTKNPEDIDDYIQVIETGKQPIDPKCKIVISSYDLLAKNVETMSKGEYKILIVDESHLLKNLKTARAKSVLKMVEYAKHVILLSGTPALSRPAELYSQISAINNKLFPTFHDFGMRYCAGKEAKFGWDYSGYSNMSELRLLLEEKLLIRREKKDVLLQLPTKMREKVQLDPSLIEHKSKTLMQASQNVQQSTTSNKRSAILVYFNETSKAKYKAVCQYIADLIESEKKFIVFAHHQLMLDEIEKECQKESYEYIRIDGATHSEKRQYLADRFQTSDNCRVAILSITAASSGLTLTKASLVVFAELFWNPGILVQAEDRVYRIGQRDSVIIQYLIAKNTADDEMWPLINEKLNVLTKAGLTKEILSEAKNIDNNENLVDPKNNIMNYFKELIDQELTQNQKQTMVEDNVNESDSDSLPNFSLDEFRLNSPGECKTNAANRVNIENDDDDDDFIGQEDQLKIISMLDAAPPNKKIKK